MKVSLFGGFGEKGRTSVGIETPGCRLILDVGINTSGKGADAYPKVDAERLRRTDAILVTHAHEDHVGALGWCFANGFSGRVYMTAETRGDMREIVAAYDAVSGRSSLDFDSIETISPGARFSIGNIGVSTGRSGHIVGGIWYALSDGDRRLIYCGDVVPHSAVFEMDPLPSCNALLYDGSYGVDPIGTDARIRDILAWIDAHPHGCLLPTPLAGRSLELLAALKGVVAIHGSMREPLNAQVAEHKWLRAGMGAELAARIAAARDWNEKAALPDCPLLVHDGMGMTGPAAIALARAGEERHPVLLTGHIPTGSPAERLLKAGQADWIRLPTHPTLPENQMLLRGCSPQIALAHSCSTQDMEKLRVAFPAVSRTLVTGQEFTL
ncbi:MAG: MBL fold metallo-hydrolase [Rhodospirillales bacterium]|nr:MBL fold metallo-hydrolase [Rhodospirillales bacterium]